MIDTFAALLFAHVLADFLLQPNGMVVRKKNVGVLLLHGAIVLATAYAALGRVDVWEPFALAGLHVLIDAIKVYALPDRLASFLGDQAAHLFVIVGITVVSPGLYVGGLWAGVVEVPAVMLLLSGFFVTTVVGGYAVALLVRQWSGAIDDVDSLPNAGRWIGLLERGIIFLLVLAGQPAGVGFLIAAKSVLRFDAERKQTVTEYVIIGTLASFGWALAASWLTVALLGLVPPLGLGI